MSWIELNVDHVIDDVHCMECYVVILSCGFLGTRYPFWIHRLLESSSSLLSHISLETVSSLSTPRMFYWLVVEDSWVVCERSNLPWNEGLMFTIAQWNHDGIHSQRELILLYFPLLMNQTAWQTLPMDLPQETNRTFYLYSWMQLFPDKWSTERMKAPPKSAGYKKDVLISRIPQ